MLIDFSGDVVKVSDLEVNSVDATPMLFSYNRIAPTIANIGTPFKSADDWWNILIEFESPVVGFEIHSIITGIEHTDDFIYRADTLDVQPAEMPPAFSDLYAHDDVQFSHCINGWTYIDLQNTVQAKFFWVKLLSDDDKTPEVSLRETDTQLKAVSVA